MARNCGPGKGSCGMKLGLFNPFFTGNYENPYSYSTSNRGEAPDKVFGSENIIWFRASENVTVDGSNNVTSWTDKGDFAEVLSGVSSFYPVKVTDGNGRAWVRFAESAMTLSSLSGFAASVSDYLMVIVWKYRGGIKTVEEGRFLNNSSGSRLIFSAPQSNQITPTYRAIATGGAGASDIQSVSGPVPQNVHIVEFDLNSSGSKIKINGVTDKTGTFTQVTFQPIGGLAFGNSAGSSSGNNLIGDIAEILFVKGTYTESQKQSVYRYFDNLYSTESRADFTETGKTTSLEDETVIFTGSGTNDYLYTPTMTINPSTNKLYLFITEGPNHGNSIDQFITLSTSTDGGYTWSARTTIIPADAVHRINQGGVCVTNTGRIIFLFYKVDWDSGNGALAIVQPYMIYSDDDGATWNSNGSDGNEILVTSDYADPGQLSGPGNPIVVSDGIIVPLYGRTGETGNRECVIYKSTDDGLTWTKYSTMAVTATMDPEEPEILVRNDGLMIGLIRSDQQDKTFMTYSWDEGLTWANSADTGTNKKIAFSANAFNGGVVTPNNTIMGMSRHATDNRTIVFKSTNKGQDYTTDYLDASTGMFVYGKGVWHPALGKIVYVHCREQDGSTSGLGPTEIVCTHWNEVNV